MKAIKGKLLICAAALLLALTFCIGMKPQEAQAATTETVAVSGTYDYTKATQALTEINKKRTSAGVSKLTMDKTLMEEAMFRAAELSVYYDSNHTRPNGSAWSTKYSKLGTTSGENLAEGYSTASAAVTGWYNSSGHRQNMLNGNYKSTGIGCFTSNGITYWVQVFSNATPTSATASGTKNVTVLVNAKSSYISGKITLVPNSSEINKGSSTSVTAYLTNKANSSYKTKIDSRYLTWSTSSSSVASVSSGTVTGKSVGSAKITAKLSGGSASGSTTITVKSPQISLSKCTITMSGSSFTYTGSAIKPTITVKYGSTTLKNGTDYTVSYSNNVNVGTGKVTITGKGNYTGTATGSFTIKKATTSLSKCSISLSGTSYTYTGSAIKPTVTVKYGSTTLKNGTDYTVSYSNNVNVGTGKVTITGKGNYTGTATVSFTIKSAGTSISKCSFSAKSAGYNSDGTAKNPIITVTYGSKTLVEGTDYTLSYSNNTTSGIGKVTVTGKGSYTGSVTLSYTIPARIFK